MPVRVCVSVCVCDIASQPSICASSSFCHKLCKNCSAITNQMASQIRTNPPSSLPSMQSRVHLSPFSTPFPAPPHDFCLSQLPQYKWHEKKVNFKKLFQSNLAICCCLLLLTPIRCHCFYGKARGSDRERERDKLNSKKMRWKHTHTHT